MASGKKIDSAEKYWDAVRQADLYYATPEGAAYKKTIRMIPPDIAPETWERLKKISKEKVAAKGGKK